MESLIHINRLLIKRIYWAFVGKIIAQNESLFTSVGFAPHCCNVG